jgi:hypothetical protein
MITLPALLAADSFPLILAQSGAAKTAIGWLLVVLALALALLVVGRPSGRRMPDK